MNKLSVKRLSILGLVLMGASAVTAAILPSKSSDNADFGFGNLALTSDAAPGGQQSCYPAGTAGNCVATTDSTTSEGANVTSDAIHSGGSVGKNTTA